MFTKRGHMNSRHLNLLLPVLALIVVSETAKAGWCTCAERSPCEAFSSSDAVFVGQMVEGETKERDHEYKGKKYSNYSGKCRLIVEEAFKGIQSTEVTINVHNLTSCGTSLALGERYLIYAGHVPDLGLAISICSSTKALSSAQSELVFLRQLSQPGSGGRILGQVAAEPGGGPLLPLEAVMVIVEDEAKRRFTTTTDSQGNFELTSMKPGRYIVSPVLPPNYRARDPKYLRKTVTVEEPGCSNATFLVMVDGSIAGNVLDFILRPVPGDVRLISTSEPARGLSVETNEKGEYTFEGVSPGTYHLFFELVDGNRQVPFYYPGTTDKTKARPVEIGFGEKRSGLSFTLPSDLRIHLISGVVRYSDGRLARHARVSLLVDTTASETLRAGHWLPTYTDEFGRFSLAGYKGLVYRIVVEDDPDRASTEDRRPTPRAEKQLTLNADVEDVEITLQLHSPDKPPSK